MKRHSTLLLLLRRKLQLLFKPPTICKVVLLSLILLTSRTVSSQKTIVDSIQILNSRIDSLEKTLSIEQYLRIPKGDFDKALDVRVQESVYNAFYKVIAVLGLIIFGGGFGLYRSLQNELKNLSQEKISEAEKSLKAELGILNDTILEKATVSDNRMKEHFEWNKRQLNDMSETQNRENNRQDILIKALSDNIAAISNRQESFLTEISTEVDKKMDNATRNIWNDIASNKLRTAKERNFKGGDLAKELEDFMIDNAAKISKEKKQMLVDSIMRCLYATQEAEIKRYYKTKENEATTGSYKNKYDEMIRLMKQYETAFELLPETYANAAIALNNNYEYYRNEEDKRLCLDCCDKSLSKLKDYGIPFVLKLEIYCIDYKKAFDETERMQSLDLLKRTLHAINTNQSNYLHIEALKRLQDDKQISYLQSYIELLDQICPTEMRELKEKAIQSILSFDILKSKDPIVVQYKDLLFTILDESNKQYPQLTGNWQAIKSTKGGTDTPDNELNTTLSFENNIVVLQDGNSSLSGYAFIAAGNTPSTWFINFYLFNNKNEYTKTVYCLSKMTAQQNFLICSNYSTTERPADFTSTLDNMYYLEEFKKDS